MRELLITSPVLREATRAVINSSLTSGTVHPSRKRAFVKPLLKKKNLDMSDPNNYRAVANNGYLSKLEERAAAIQLTAHVEANNLLDDNQLGFRKGKSTETATTAIWEDIKLNADRNEATALILLDLSAAFDTVHHKTLLRRLQELGITGTANKWIEAFLSNRTQITWTPPFKSAEKPIRHGVPQGASISPLLFNLYMKPLLKIIRDHQIKGYNYADDTQLLVTFKDPRKHGPPLLKECMSHINSWMNANHLVLNPKKTVIMLTGNKRCFPASIPWPEELGPAPLTSEDCVNLGIIMDRELLLKKHCNRIARSCINQTRLLRKVVPFLAFPQKLTAAMSCILSRLDFANSIMLGTSKENLHTLQRAQNMAARLVLNLGPRDRISRALHELHWLPIGNRIAFKALCIAHRAIYEETKNVLTRRFVKATSTRPQRNGGGPTLIVPAFNKSKAGGNAFVRSASKLWNTLPGTLRSIADHLKFRRKLKTWLFPSDLEASRGNRMTRISYLPATEDRGGRRIMQLNSPTTTITGSGQRPG